MRSQNIFLLCSYKIVALDYHLPLALELNKRFKNLNFYVLFPDHSAFEYFILNQDIVYALKRLDAKILVLRKGSRILSVFGMFRLFIIMFCSKNVLLKRRSLIPWHNMFIKVARIVSETFEIRCDYVSHTDDIKRNICYFKDLIPKNQRKVRNEDYSDFFITSKSNSVENVRSKTIRIGYPRALPEWNAFVRDAYARWSSGSNQSYFFFALSALHKRREIYNEPDIYDVFCESLMILKNFNDKILTVFKPHQTTELDKLKSAIRETAYRNFIISYAHPSVISFGAKFVITNCYSTVQADAFYLGVPTIDYYQYDPEVMRINGYRSEGGDCVDFFIERDPAQLKSIVGGILSGKVRVRRDRQMLRTKFPKTPESFWEFWKRNLGMQEREQ